MVVPYDLTAIEQFLSSTSSIDSQQDRGMIQPHSTIEDTSGMSFSELFSHYLAPEVAKLPNSTSSSSSNLLPSFTDSSFTFGGGGASSNATSTDFDPSTFMPSHIPGSPISPSENGSLLSHSQSAASPISFADFEDMFTNNGANDTTNTSTGVEDFAIDPSIFEQPASTSTFTPSPQQSLSGISLPALDNGFAPVSVSSLPPLPSTSTLPFDLPIPPPPAHSNYPQLPSQAPELTASGRPKRNVSSMIIQEEEEEDEDMYRLPSTQRPEQAPESASEEEEEDSDASAHTTTRSTRARSSKPPQAKKSRSSSSTTQKKLPKTSVLPLASDELYKTSKQSNLPPVPQWADKPDEEEYKKLSSKEKRQLRNKISARNFRHRRKEYITTLEEEISTRDNLIGSLQDQVSTLKTDNEGLKSEVGMLKTKWQELLDKMSSLADNNSTTSTGGVGLGVNAQKALSGGAGGVQVKEEDGSSWALDTPETSTRRTRGSNGIARPNLSKDLPPRRSTNSWSSQGFGGGYQSVHTTLIPDLSTSLASHLTQKSFNPALNSLSPSQLSELPSLTSHLRPPAPTQSNNSAFADLFSTNPFYLHPSQLDTQRAQLYSRIAHNTAGLQQARKQNPSSASSNDNLPIPQGFKPAFFSSPPPPPTKSVDKHQPDSSTTSELLSFQSPSNASHQDLFASRLAGIAQQTLLSKMSSAFLSAFSGAQGVENAKAVISGRARLAVVPVEGKGLSGLEEGMGRMGLGQGRVRENSCGFDEVVNRWTKVESVEKKK